MTPIQHMERALFLAARGRGRTSPNPLVGAVVVTPDGVVVGQGAHERAGEPHAEVHALNAAGARARGATLYCTLEPCCHVGRTGPCAHRIVAAGIARVVAAVEDPNPLVSGHGFAYLRGHGVDVDVGVGAEAAHGDESAVLHAHARGTPVRDPEGGDERGRAHRGAGGRAHRADVGGRQPSRAARTRRGGCDRDRFGHAARGRSAAHARGAYREQPLTRVIFDRRLRTPPTARVLSTGEAGPVIIVTSAEAAARDAVRTPLEARGAEIEIAPDASFGAALERLGARGIGSLLLEGGAALHAAAWDEGLVDFVRLYVTPHVLGPDGVPLLDGRPFTSAALIGRRVEPLGADVLIEGYVHGPR